jgi:hypothetical protein
MVEPPRTPRVRRSLFSRGASRSCRASARALRGCGSRSRRRFRRVTLAHTGQRQRSLEGRPRRAPMQSRGALGGWEAVSCPRRNHTQQGASNRRDEACLGPAGANRRCWMRESVSDACRIAQDRRIAIRPVDRRARLAVGESHLQVRCHGSKLFSVAECSTQRPAGSLYERLSRGDPRRACLSWRRDRGPEGGAWLVSRHRHADRSELGLLCRGMPTKQQHVVPVRPKQHESAFAWRAPPCCRRDLVAGRCAAVGWQSRRPPRPRLRCRLPMGPVLREQPAG